MLQQQEEQIENKSNEKVRAFAKALYEKDIKTTYVKKNETIAVLGYGLQGRAQASNLSDSGFKVTVGLRKDGASWNLAKKDGHKVMEVQDAAKEASIIHVLVPDMVQSDLYKKIEPYVTKGKALGFSHGAAIHWGWIKPPSNVDVFMIAPSLCSGLWNPITSRGSSRCNRPGLAKDSGTRKGDRQREGRSHQNNIQGGS